MAKYFYILFLVTLCAASYGQKITYSQYSLRIPKDKFTCQTESKSNSTNYPSKGKNRAIALMMGGGILAIGSGILNLATRDTESRLYKSSQAGIGLGIMFFGVGGCATMANSFQQRYALIIERNQLGVAYNFK